MNFYSMGGHEFLAHTKVSRCTNVEAGKGAVDLHRKPDFCCLTLPSFRCLLTCLVLLVFLFYHGFHGLGLLIIRKTMFHDC